MRTETKEKLLDVLLLSAVMFGIAAVIYRRYLFGDMTYIFRDAGSDTFNQYWPVIEQFIRKLKDGTLSFWLFDMGLGTTTISILDYVFDPFTMVLLLFPKGYLAYGLVWIAVLKEMTAGLLFYFFAREASLSRFPSIIGALCWAFSGFLVLWGQHYFFATVIPGFTLVMLGVLVYWKRRTGKLLILGLVLQAMGSVYFTFWVVVGLLIAVPLLYLLTEKRSWKGFFGYFFGFFFRGLIAAGISAFRWLPSAMFLIRSFQFSDGARTPDPSFFWQKKDYLDFALRGFSNNSLGISSWNVLSYNYYEQIMWASSILSIVFLFHNLIVRKGRQRIFVAANMIFVFAAFLTRIPALIMNVGKDDKWRWSFLIIFVLVVNLSFALEDIVRNGRKRLVLLIGELAFAGLALMISFMLLWRFFGVQMAPEDLLESRQAFRGCIIVLLLFCGVFLLLLLSKKDTTRKAAMILSAGVLSVELILLNAPTLGEQRISVPKKGAYTMDYFSPGNREAIDWVNEQEDGLFRMERVMTCGGNDPLMMQYPGTFLYGMYEKEIGEFYAVNGLQGAEGDYTSRLAGNPVLESLLGIRYMLSSEPLQEDGYQEVKKISVYNEAISQEETVLINRNGNAFPLLYTTDPESAKIIDSIASGDYSAGDIRELKKKIREIPSQSRTESEITGRVTSDTDTLLLTSIPYDTGWRLFIDGKRSDLFVVNTGFVGAVLPSGSHEIRLSFLPDGLIPGIVVSILAFVILYCFRVVNKKRKSA